MCQLDWAIGCCDICQIVFWVCLWGCFWMRLTFESVDWVKQIALPNVGGLIQSTDGWPKLNIYIEQMKTKIKQKSWVRGSFACLTVWAGTLVFSCPQTITHITSSPGSPNCQLQIWGLLSFYNCASQFSPSPLSPVSY